MLMVSNQFQTFLFFVLKVLFNYDTVIMTPDFNVLKIYSCSSTRVHLILLIIGLANIGHANIHIYSWFSLTLLHDLLVFL